MVADDDLDLALDLEIDEEDIVVTLDLGPEIDEGLVVLGEGVVILEADREAIPEVGLEVTAEAGRDQEVADNQQTFFSIQHKCYQTKPISLSKQVVKQRQAYKLPGQLFYRN